MANQTTFPKFLVGQWVPLCEKRIGRRSLIIDVQNAAVILAINMAGPQVSSALGLSPAGLLLTPATANSRSVFRLSKECDGDLVEEAWNAWALTGTAPPAINVTVAFADNGTFTVPAGVTSIDIVAGGAGGGSAVSSAAAGPSMGGGGGAYSATAGFVVTPGQLLTIQCWPGGAVTPNTANPDTWISTTGVAPLLTTTGVLAKSGVNANIAGSIVVAPGGQAATSIGTTKNNGGPSGATAGYPPGAPATGSGGGGRGTALLAGTAGGAGVNGLAAGGAGGVTGGGNGGASDGTAPLTGITGAAGAGSGGSAVTAAGATGGPISSTPGILTVTYLSQPANVLTVIESFGERAAASQGAMAMAIQQPTAMPAMSPAAWFQFKQWLKKMCP